ncbi:hypothetical protein D1B31_17805 [Neobacillus notoginsengisoli]|uniref:Uncharacterized protein n=1 Tax=Neobacillus notoginsengisoli TaxID=1578198 RepID=A0A417YPM9_9BACI|nr:hypothetical protein [Neobacillus notoginsengisoli]RHW35947.1 hypothetical protein D1B31_17805 [Neobacillus notoginsengisoli]
MANTALKETPKTTGYSDIDQLFHDTDKFLQDAEQIQEEIVALLKYKPVDPFTKTHQRPRFRLRTTK